MSNRCPDCNKFATLEFQDPEESLTEFDPETGHIEAEYRIIRNCADCGTEMKEATITFDEQLDSSITDAHTGDGHGLSAEFSAEQYEEGGGRYAKAYFGVELTVTITCECGSVNEVLTLVEKEAASSMDDLN